MLRAKQKKCKVCNGLFTPRGMSHIYCSPNCAIIAARLGENSAKTAPKKIDSEKKIIKNKAFYLKKLQSVFNTYIRLRDDIEPCISCGQNRTKYHAGHYLSVGGHSELRFCELNVHKQCVYCNMYLHGNLLNYRKGLINKIGLDNVEWLESNHEICRHTSDELQEMIALYKDKIKLLETTIMSGYK